MKLKQLFPSCERSKFEAIRVCGLMCNWGSNLRQRLDDGKWSSTSLREGTGASERRMHMADRSCGTASHHSLPLFLGFGIGPLGICKGSSNESAFSLLRVRTIQSLSRKTKEKSSTAGKRRANVSEYGQFNNEYKNGWSFWRDGSTIHISAILYVQCTTDVPSDAIALPPDRETQSDGPHRAVRSFLSFRC